MMALLNLIDLINLIDLSGSSGLTYLLPSRADSAVVLIDSALRATVILGAALGVTLLLRRRSAALRHLVMSLAIAGALLTPVMTSVAPAWRPDVVDRALRSVRTANAAAPKAPAADDVTIAESVRLDVVGNEKTQTATSANSAAGTRSATRTPLANAVSSAAAIIMPIWIAGVIVFAGVLLTGLARLRWLASRSREVSGGNALAALVNEIAVARGVRKPIALVWSDRARLLVTWGHFRPRIMLPAAAAGWSEERLRVVISHELAHVRRGDWSTQLAAEVLRAVFWFNPLVWIACRRLRAESELACDDEVLNGGIEGVDYAGHLLDLARVLNSPRHAWLSAPAMARPSSLEGRISAMLNAGLNRHPVTRVARAVTCALVLGLTLAVAGFAQSSFYTFSGVVVDSTDRVVSGVTLTLTNTARGARYEVKTDASGRFEFVGLPSGEYGLEAERMGFKAVKDTIAIAGSNVSNRRIALQVGQVRETISVKGAGSAHTAAVSGESDNAALDGRRQKVLSNCRPSETSAGGVIEPPLKLRDVKPIYPAELNAANIGGTVAMEALIDTNGDVQDVTVVNSPDAGLATAATESVKQWKYTPTLLNCAPIDVRMGVTITFTPKQ
jgi:TonB family protein